MPSDEIRFWLEHCAALEDERRRLMRERRG